MSANNIQASGDGLIQAIAGQPTKFYVNPNGQGLEGITFAVEGPSNPTFSFNYLNVNNPQGDGQMMIVEATYTPAFPGSYKIYVKFFGRDIPGSPFKVNIMGDNQSVEKLFTAVENIKVSGKALTNGMSLVTNQFILGTNYKLIEDARNSGVAGGLNVFMEGPGRAEVGFKENLDGTIHVQYKPYNSGVYKLYLKFGEVNVPGSPFSIDVN